MPTLITRYVNVNSPTGGNGTTPSTASGDPNRAYRGFSASLAAERVTYENLVASDVILKIDCAGGLDLSLDTTLPAYTTDYDRYVWLYSSPENSHKGVWDTSKYTIGCVASTVIVLDKIPNLRIEGIQLENRSTNGVWSILQSSDATTQNRSLDVDRCFLRSISGSGNNGSAISVSYILRKRVRVANSIIQGKFSSGIYAQYISSGSPASLVYNNTFYDCIDGMDFRASADAAVIHIKNNIVSGSGLSYLTGSNTTASNNISSDDTSPNIQFRNMVPSFVSTISSSLNLQLSDNDTIAKDRGASLVNDSIYPFSTDIANNPRPQRFSLWDIGAFENSNGKNKIVTNNANVFVDNFNRADGALGSNYDTATTFTSLNVNANAANGSGSVSFNSIKPSVKTFNPNQEAQVTYTAFAASYFDFAGPAVRVNSTNGTGYILYIDSLNDDARRLRRVTGSVSDIIGTVNLSAVVGDVFKLVASGSRLLVYKNNILVDSVTDTTYPTGQPGLYYDRQNSNIARMDNFIAADISTTNAKTLFTISQTPVGNLIQGSQ